MIFTKWAPQLMAARSRLTIPHSQSSIYTIFAKMAPNPHVSTCKNSAGAWSNRSSSADGAKGKKGTVLKDYPSSWH